MNMCNLKLFFWCLCFVIGFYHVQADILKQIRIAEEKALNDYRFIFYGLCHINPIEHDLIYRFMVPYPPFPLSDRDVTFLFFSRNNPFLPKVIAGNEPASNIASLGIDFSKETVLFCDGYATPSIISSILFPRILLPQKDINIITTDWDLFILENLIYSSNVTTMRLGKVIGDFLEKLVNVGLDPKKTTLMGFSMGAQAVALAAQRIRPKISRIIAFSPDGTCFNFQPDDQRLTIDDADFVVIVHMTTGIFEYYLNHVGNATFYVNGGILQPQCTFVPTLFGLNACCHFFSLIYLYISLLNTNIIQGVRCDSYEDYVRGKCDCDDKAVLKYDIANSTKGLYFIDSILLPKKLCELNETHSSLESEIRMRSFMFYYFIRLRIGNAASVRSLRGIILSIRRSKAERKSLPRFQKAQMKVLKNVDE